MQCTVRKHPIIIAIYENYVLFACRFDYIYRESDSESEWPQSHLPEDLPPHESNAYELQLNQIIRHHNEWIISPGYLSQHSMLWQQEIYRPTRCTAIVCTRFKCIIDGQQR